MLRLGCVFSIAIENFGKVSLYFVFSARLVVVARVLRGTG